MSRALVHQRSEKDEARLDRATAIRNAIAAKLGRGVAGGSTALLLDTTGSMYGDKIRKLREAASAFPGVRRFQYADDIREMSAGESVREPYGNNNEPGAFRYLKTAGIGHVVLITDGYPDNPAESLRAAVGLRIDIIYIGPKPEPQFLRDLARATGGSYDGSVTFADVDGGKQLQDKVTLLLEAGKPVEAAKPQGAILL